jgi:hypothetical protein
MEMAEGQTPKPESYAFAVALAAGLEKAVQQFPEDVADAAQAAARARATCPRLDDATAEPWPPMRIRGGT